ncbi:MAG: hypothetical protein WCS27_02155, partial [Victivallaceae bacterium]
MIMKELKIGVIGVSGRGGLARAAHKPEDGCRVVAGADIKTTALQEFKEHVGNDVFVTGLPGITETTRNRRGFHYRSGFSPRRACRRGPESRESCLLGKAGCNCSVIQRPKALVEPLDGSKFCATCCAWIVPLSKR